MSMENQTKQQLWVSHRMRTVNTAGFTSNEKRERSRLAGHSHNDPIPMNLTMPRCIGAVPKEQLDL